MNASQARDRGELLPKPQSLAAWAALELSEGKLTELARHVG